MVAKNEEETVPLDELRNVTFFRIKKGNSSYLDENFKNLLKEVCVSVLRTHPLLQQVNHIDIGIHDVYEWTNGDETLDSIEQRALSGKGPTRPLGYVFKEEVFKGLNRIHLNIDDVYEMTFRLVKGNRKRIFRAFILEIRKVVSHEGAHLWHFINSYEVRRLSKAVKKLEKNLNKRLKKERVPAWPEKYLKPLVSLRVAELSFMGRLQAEGLGRFYEKRLQRKLPLDWLTSQNLYTAAKTSAIEIVGRINLSYELMYKCIEEHKQLELKKVARNLLEHLEKYLETYTIGVHMVYTLYALGRHKVEEIANMSHLEFIRRYEELLPNSKSIQTPRMRPLVSLNSGKGILDYNTIIKQWLSLVEMLQRKKDIIS